MVADDDLRKRLNLLQIAPTFAYRQHPNGTADVVQPTLIPNDDWPFWIAGTTRLANGRSVDSVFVVEKSNVNCVFWSVDEDWYRSDDADTLEALGLNQQDVFPFDWDYAIAVDTDIFHSRLR